MPVESATYIHQLDAANPLAADSRSEGDDHLRLIKSAIKATFPNVTGTVVASHTELGLLAGISAAQSLVTLDINRNLIQPVGLRTFNAGVVTSTSINIDAYNMAECVVNSGSTLTLTLTGTVQLGKRMKIFVENATAGTLTVTWAGIGVVSYIPNAGVATALPIGHTYFDISFLTSKAMVVVYNSDTLT